MAKRLAPVSAVFTAKDEGFSSTLNRMEAKASRWGAAVSASLSRMSSFFLAGGGVVAAVSAAHLAVQTVVDSIARVDQIADAASRLGVATDRLQRLQYAAVQAGLSAEKLDSLLHRMSQTIAEDAASEDGGVLGKLGLDAKTLARLDPVEQLRRIADAVSRLGTAGERLSAVNGIFGRGGRGIANLLAGGSAGIDAMIAKAAQDGIGLSERQVEAIQKTDDAVKRLQMVWQSFADTFASSITPPVRTALQGITEAMIALQRVPLGDVFRAGARASKEYTVLGRVYNFAGFMADSYAKANDILARIEEANDRVRAMQADRVEREVKMRESTEKANSAVAERIKRELDLEDASKQFSERQRRMQEDFDAYWDDELASRVERAMAGRMATEAGRPDMLLAGSGEASRAAAVARESQFTRAADAQLEELRRQTVVEEESRRLLEQIRRDGVRINGVLLTF